jgi:5-hydroxyisourate hydrolase-like protein (transthyretin family)
MTRGAYRLVLVLLLGSFIGVGWWLAHREGQGRTEEGDPESADVTADATHPPPGLASLEGNADAAASRRTRLPRGEGAIVGTVLRDGAPVAARIAIHVTHVGAGYAPFGRGELALLDLAFGLRPDAASGSVPAGEDGRFAIADLGAGAFRLVAETADGATGATFALLPVEGARIEVSISVVGGGESLRGRVVWADGRPFRGSLRVIPIQIDGRNQFPNMPEGRVVRADAEGRFVATGLSAGPVTVTAYVEEHLVVTGAATLPHDGEYVLTLDAGLVRVVGRVLREGDDAPIPGASVTAVGRSSSQHSVMSRASTGADGRFEVSAPEGTGARLLAIATGFASTAVPAPPAASAEPLVIRLSRGATVTGRVTRDADGDPVAGLTVTATALGSRAADHIASVPEPSTTDADGRYTITGASPGEAMVVASGQGHVTKGLEQASREGFNPLAVTLTDGQATTVDLVVTAGARIEGVVLDAGGAPVVGAIVDSRPRSDGLGQLAAAAPVATDKEGRFVIDGNVPGLACFLTAEAPGRTTVRAGPVTPVAGTTTTIEVRFAAARFIDVTVVDDAAGTPIAGARLKPRSWGGSKFAEVATFTTSSDGRIRVGPMPAGEQRIKVGAPGYPESELTVRESETSLVVRLKAGRDIAGRVTFADGTPAAGVTVTREDARMPDPSARTGADGTFLLRSVPAQPVTLRARTSKDGTVHEAMVSVEAGTRDVVLRLAPQENEARAGRVVVCVLDPAGKPVPRARAMWRTKTGSSGTGVTDGRVEWNRTTSPDAEATIEVWGARSADGRPLPLGPALVRVPFGATELEVRLPAELVVSGTVHAPDGAPVRGILVQAQPVAEGESRWERWGNDAPQARTDDVGTFRLGGLGAEEYDLTFVVPPTYAPVTAVRVRGGDRDVDVRLKAGLTVSVTVHDVDGKPVPDATVSGRPRRTGDALRSLKVVRDTSATTGVDGVARLSGIDADVTYTLHVAAKSEDLSPVTLDSWTPRDETVTLPRVWIVSGVVRDQAGRPVANAEVMRRVGDDGWNGIGTDEQGRFKLTGLPQGNVVLRAKVQGLRRVDGDTTGDVTVPAGTKDIVLTVDLGLELTVRVDNLAAQGRVSIPGTLLVHRDGQVMHLLAQGAGSGSYRFQGLQTGDECAFWIHVGGTLGARTAYATGLKPGADVQVSAAEGRSITGMLKMPAGSGNVRVGASTPEGFGVGAQVNPDGTFEIRGLPEGITWTVAGTARSPDGSTWLTGQATVSAGATVEIELKPQESPQGK